MTLEELFAVLEDLGGMAGTIVHDTEPLLEAEIPHVGERHDALYAKLDEIDYAAKGLLRRIEMAMTQVEGAMGS